MSFGHDPEVPAGYQDADIEMLEMREAANEAREREETHKEWEREATSLDEQDLNELISLVSSEFFTAMAETMIPVGELHRSEDWVKEHPSQRMVAIKNLETKLIRMKMTVLHGG